MPSDAATAHVIDDDEGLRDSLMFLLRAADIAAQSHASAVAFLEALPRAHAGCIITDVRMPGLSGIDLLRRLDLNKVGLVTGKPQRAG